MDTVDGALHGVVEEASSQTKTVIADAKAAAEAVINSKADKSTTLSKTLTASAWTGTTAPYSITLSVSGVTASNNIEIIPELTTPDLIVAWEGLGYISGGQADGKVTLSIWNSKPTIDIPITIVVRGD